ncbi:SURF1 family protein [Ramlibacter sp. G-1-2-2]|uniref:SURF1-like protein n=1 Tax=Ramlibacter agri TaxID=2728837 RepID=A0A848H020_9BURK|nr:SURF1 family protein [Ramlibacter agri]NML42889.1 SURF1 family protein [Ramlibacter agri]
MDAEARSRRSPALLVSALALLLFLGAAFAALGVWQVQRLAWKEDLIARVDRQLKAEPGPLPAPAQWAAISKDQDEYRRVLVQGQFDDRGQVLVRALTELGTGYWVLTPLRTDAGWVIVNRGFVPPDMREQVPPGRTLPPTPALLRISEPGGSFMQKNQPAHDRWYSRDVDVIAAARHLEGPVAPFFVDLQVTPVTQKAWPRPGLTVLDFPNNHLSYALTWFALAAGMIAAMVFLILDERRRRRAPYAHAVDERA